SCRGQGSGGVGAAGTASATGPGGVCGGALGRSRTGGGVDCAAEGASEKSAEVPCGTARVGGAGVAAADAEREGGSVGTATPAGLERGAGVCGPSNGAGKDTG